MQSSRYQGILSILGGGGKEICFDDIISGHNNCVVLEHLPPLARRRVEGSQPVLINSVFSVRDGM